MQKLCFDDDDDDEEGSADWEHFPFPSRFTMNLYLSLVSYVCLCMYAYVGPALFHSLDIVEVISISFSHTTTYNHVCILIIVCMAN